MILACGNQLCAYWSDDACILGKVSLDEQGSCIDCMTVELSEEFLARKRKELLEELDRREAGWRELDKRRTETGKFNSD